MATRLSLIASLPNSKWLASSLCSPAGLVCKLLIPNLDFVSLSTKIVPPSSEQIRFLLSIQAWMPWCPEATSKSLLLDINRINPGSRVRRSFSNKWQLTLGFNTSICLVIFW